MAAFITPVDGNNAIAEHVAQLTQDFSGLRNIPIQLTGINDAATYAQAIKNIGAGSKDCIMYAADGTTVLFQVDATGVKASASGGAAAPILTSASGSIANANLGSDTARANLLTNGGFEIWQRGNGPFAANGVFTADRWATNIDGTDTLSVSRDATNIDAGSQSAIAGTCVRGTGVFTSLIQRLSSSVESIQLKNRTVTFSMRVRTATASAVRLAILDNSGVGRVYGSYHTGDGTWQTLTVTAGPLTGTFYQCEVYFQLSCTAYLDNAMLVVGSQAADYAPLHLADDLARCFRYYQVLGPNGGSSLNISGIATAGGQTFRTTLTFIQKAVMPTITKVGTWTLGNAGGQPGIPTFDIDSLVLTVSSAAAGDTYAQNGAGCRITIESNP